MRSWMVGLLAMASLSAGPALAAEIESGPEIGGKTSAFRVKDVTGPSKGKSLCYR